MPKNLPPIVIVGGGLAGVFCALKLAPRPVAILAPTPVGASGSSYWAQGGIAAAVAEGDTPERHADDTAAAGAGIVDREIALGMAREARDRIEALRRTQDFAQVQAGIVKKHASRAPGRTAPPRRRSASAPGQLSLDL